MGECECRRCGELFESATERLMHVVRRRCPKIDDQEDADSADAVHALEEAMEE